VAAYFTRFGTSSIRINFDVLHLGSHRLAATGNEVLVCTDRNTMSAECSEWAPMPCNEPEDRCACHCGRPGVRPVGLRHEGRR
jgi:hypothetical protein